MQLSKKCTEQKGLKPFENCNQLEKASTVHCPVAIDSIVNMSIWF